jgi:hypothetical protein
MGQSFLLLISLVFPIGGTDVVAVREAWDSPERPDEIKEDTHEVVSKQRVAPGSVQLRYYYFALHYS